MAEKTSNLTTYYATSARTVGGREDLWDQVTTVSAGISITGDIAGTEVTQLYASFPTEDDQSVRQLRRFQKVLI